MLLAISVAWLDGAGSALGTRRMAARGLFLVDGTEPAVVMRFLKTGRQDVVKEAFDKLRGGAFPRLYGGKACLHEALRHRQAVDRE